ncbi:hypothetical protein KAX08_03265, partial [candidate division WOR-3 bacterium]|nr:hypothetical protein [candidate division WOR-3 bacterium]
MVKSQEDGITINHSGKAEGYDSCLPFFTPSGEEKRMLSMSWVVSSPGHPPLMISRLTKVSVLKMLGRAEIS